MTHPEGPHKHLIGTKVRTPFFGAEIEIHGHHLAQPDKGTGAAMVCTFGDVTDIIWWRELRTAAGDHLPNMTTIGLDGRFLPTAPSIVADAEAIDWYQAELAGKTVFSARKAIVEKLQETGDMTAVGKPFNHAVKFFEKGDRPLEIVSTRQWYIRNGARDAKLRDELLERGTQLTWHPDFMRVRYENWVGGLTGDWLVSRQRFFGVPIPLWYGLDENGERDYDRVIAPDHASLPMTRRPTSPRATPRTSAVRPADSRPKPTSSTPGRPRRSLRSSPADGSATRSCGSSPLRSTCAPRARTSSAPGSSRPCCARLSRTPDRRGATPRSRASSSTPTARRCRSPRATW